MVKADWLAESIRLGRIASTIDFAYTLNVSLRMYIYVLEMLILSQYD